MTLAAFSIAHIVLERNKIFILLRSLRKWIQKASQLHRHVCTLTFLRVRLLFRVLLSLVIGFCYIFAGFNFVFSSITIFEKMPLQRFT